jgi:GNAT superfamily N-acetyltransferase
MNLTIRQAALEDLPMVLPLYRYLGMDDGTILDITEARSLFLRIAAYPDYKVYMAEIEGEVIGTFALLIMDNLGHHGKPSAVLEDVVVHPTWRGKGIGGRMVRFAMSLAAAKGCYKISLTSDLRRWEAHRFYEKAGFHRHGISFSLTL